MLRGIVCVVISSKYNSTICYICERMLRGIVSVGISSKYYLDAPIFYIGEYKKCNMHFANSAVFFLNCFKCLLYLVKSIYMHIYIYIY